MKTSSASHAGAHRCLVEVGAAREVEHEQVVGSAAMFWGALRRIWDPACGIALVVSVDGPAVRVAFDVTGDDPGRVSRYAETIRSLARHTARGLDWRDVSADFASQPEFLVASFRLDRRREPVVSRIPVGLSSLVETSGPWMLRLDLVAPLDRQDPPDPTFPDEPAEALVSLSLYGRPGPAGDAAAALLATDLAGPVSLVPEWDAPALPIELPAAGLHHLLAIPGRLASFLPHADPHDERSLADLLGALSAPHVLVLGNTGSGKSTSIVHLAAVALLAGESVVAVDTHDGMMLNNLAAQARRAGRPVLHVSFGVPGGPVLDVTEVPPGVGVALWVQNLWALIRHDLWQTMPDEYFGPVGEKSVLTLLELAVRSAEFTLSDVTRLLDPSEVRFRRGILAGAHSPEIARSVEREIMPMMSSRDNSAVFISGKFAPFSSGLFRSVTTGDGPRIPFEQALERGVSILIHAPASNLGEVPARTLIGAALRRLWLHLARRGGGPRVTVLLDEWQKYAAGSAITMLTESRKYGVRLVLANQVLTQLSADLRNAVLGNTGAIACYRVSPQDALALDGVFPSISMRRLQTLPKHTIALTRFEDDLIIAGPSPLEGHEAAADFGTQLTALGLDDPSERRALLARLAHAMQVASRSTGGAGGDDDGDCIDLSEPVVSALFGGGASRGPRSRR